MKKIFLDKSYMDLLEIMLYKEGLCKVEEDPFDGDEHYSLEFLNVNNTKMKSNLFKYLILFESIDSTFTRLKIEDLKSAQIIDENSQLEQSWLRSKSNTSGDIHRQYMIGKIDPVTYEFSNLETCNILRGSKNEIIKILAKEMKRNGFERPDLQYISKNFESYISQIQKGNIIQESYGRIGIAIESLHDHLQHCVHYSFVENTPFLSTIPIQSSPIGLTDKIKIIDDILYHVRLRIPSEIKYFPSPRNLEETLELRSTREIIRYREVFHGWLSEFMKNGAGNTTQRIQKDLENANRALQRLKSVREIKDGYLYFIISMIGGFIPYIKEVIKIVNVCTKIGIPHLEKNHSWVSIIPNGPKSR